MATDEDAVIILLTQEEIDLAIKVGTKRRKQSKSYQVHHGLDDSHEARLRADICGAAGEIAAARAIGVPYVETYQTFKKADILPDIQVRTTERPDGWMPFREGDSLGQRWILVNQVIRLKEYKVAGWIYGSYILALNVAGLIPPYPWGNPKGKPCLFVPSKVMNTMRFFL